MKASEKQEGMQGEAIKAKNKNGRKRGFTGRSEPAPQ